MEEHRKARERKRRAESDDPRVAVGPSAMVDNDNGSMMKTSDVWLSDGSEPTGEKKDTE